MLGGLVALLGSSWTVAAEGVPLAKGDTILFYGNAMVERLLEHGELEAYVQLAHPGKDLKVRSLAWTGDEVGYRLRPDGYAEHLKTLLAELMYGSGLRLMELLRLRVQIPV